MGVVVRTAHSPALPPEPGTTAPRGRRGTARPSRGMPGSGAGCRGTPVRDPARIFTHACTHAHAHRCARSRERARAVVMLQSFNGLCRGGLTGFGVCFLPQEDQYGDSGSWAPRSTPPLPVPAAWYWEQPETGGLAPRAGAQRGASCQRGAAQFSQPGSSAPPVPQPSSLSLGLQLLQFPSPVLPVRLAQLPQLASPCSPSSLAPQPSSPGSPAPFSQFPSRPRRALTGTVAVPAAGSGWGVLAPTRDPGDRVGAQPLFPRAPAPGLGGGWRGSPQHPPQPCPQHPLATAARSPRRRRSHLAR